MKTLSSIATLAVMSMGCVACGPIVKDISSSEAAAQINIPNRSCIFGPPIIASTVVVNAGPVSLVQKCIFSQSSDVFDKAGIGVSKMGKVEWVYRNFRFDAVPGASYEVVDGCLYLVGNDTSTEEQAIVCPSPYY